MSAVQIPSKPVPPQPPAQRGISRQPDLANGRVGNGNLKLSGAPVHLYTCTPVHPCTRASVLPVHPCTCASPTQACRPLTCPPRPARDFAAAGLMSGRVGKWELETVRRARTPVHPCARTPVHLCTCASPKQACRPLTCPPRLARYFAAAGLTSGRVGNWELETAWRTRVPVRPCTRVPVHPCTCANLKQACYPPPCLPARPPWRSGGQVNGSKGTTYPPDTDKPDGAAIRRNRISAPKGRIF